MSTSNELTTETFHIVEKKDVSSTTIDENADDNTTKDETETDVMTNDKTEKDDTEKNEEEDDDDEEEEDEEDDEEDEEEDEDDDDDEEEDEEEDEDDEEDEEDEEEDEDEEHDKNEDKDYVYVLAVDGEPVMASDVYSTICEYREKLIKKAITHFSGNGQLFVTAGNSDKDERILSQLSNNLLWRTERELKHFTIFSVYKK